MTRQEFVTMMEGDFRALVELNRTKGSDYAGAEDALANFKREAANLGLDPIKVWGVYASKHWGAVMTYVREGAVQSEPVEGRLHDLILYCFLLLGMLREGSA